jgi:hypothetical protein
MRKTGLAFGVCLAKKQVVGLAVSINFLSTYKM